MGSAFHRLLWAMAVVSRAMICRFRAAHLHSLQVQGLRRKACCLPTEKHPSTCPISPVRDVSSRLKTGLGPGVVSGRNGRNPHRRSPHQVLTGQAWLPLNAVSQVPTPGQNAGPGRNCTDDKDHAMSARRRLAVQIWSRPHEGQPRRRRPRGSGGRRHGHFASVFSLNGAFCMSDREWQRFDVLSMRGA